MGARSTRSTTRSPATTSHNSVAMQIDSTLSPKFRKENDIIAITPWRGPANAGD
jgi:hypothetical protein